MNCISNTNDNNDKSGATVSNNDNDDDNAVNDNDGDSSNTGVERYFEVGGGGAKYLPTKISWGSWGHRPLAGLRGSTPVWGQGVSVFSNWVTRELHNCTIVDLKGMSSNVEEGEGGEGNWPRPSSF